MLDNTYPGSWFDIDMIAGAPLFFVFSVADIVYIPA